jgi:hypothetical protein
MTDFDYLLLAVFFAPFSACFSHLFAFVVLVIVAGIGSRGLVRKVSFPKNWIFSIMFFLVAIWIGSFMIMLFLGWPESAWLTP